MISPGKTQQWSQVPGCRAGAIGRAPEQFVPRHGVINRVQLQAESVPPVQEYVSPRAACNDQFVAIDEPGFAFSPQIILELAIQKETLPAGAEGQPEDAIVGTRTQRQHMF